MQNWGPERPSRATQPAALRRLGSCKVRSGLWIDYDYARFIKPVYFNGTPWKSLSTMNDVTKILTAIDLGNATAAEQLFPLVYEELRQLAVRKLSQERPGQTLSATALVHEAYLRLVGDQHFENRRHFFAAAAQAMRRILIESARRKQLLPRVDARGIEFTANWDNGELLELNDALDRLAVSEPIAAKIVEARVFSGLSIEDAGVVLGISRAAAYREWKFARAWLASVLADSPKNSPAAEKL